MEEHMTRSCGFIENLSACGSWVTKNQKPAIVALFLILQIVATSEPAFGRMTIEAIYVNGVYMGCTIITTDGEGNTYSPTRIDESSCLRGQKDFPPARRASFVYVSAYRFGDFNDLGTRALSRFTPLRERNPDGSFQTPIFGATIVESGTQAGVGAGLRLNDWLALDLGLTVGSGTASRTSSNLPPVREEADFRLFGGSITAKVYPLQSAVTRVQPWLSAGVRGLALSPTGGTYTTFSQGEQRLDLPGRRFEPTSMADLVSGAGVDVRLTDRFGVTFSGQHGFDTGWLAGVGLTFTLSPRTPEVFPPQPTTGELSPRSTIPVDSFSKFQSLGIGSIDPAPTGESVVQ